MIMLSAAGSEDGALAAMREGAYDYVHKPLRPDEVTLKIRKAEEREKSCAARSRPCAPAWARAP